MGSGQSTEREGWATVRAQSAVSDFRYWRERSAEFTLFARVSSTLRSSRWQQVQKIHGFDFTVHGFEFQQRGEQQCLYWQIPNIKAR